MPPVPSEQTPRDIDFAPLHIPFYDRGPSTSGYQKNPEQVQSYSADLVIPSAPEVGAEIQFTPESHLPARPTTIGCFDANFSTAGLSASADLKQTDSFPLFPPSNPHTTISSLAPQIPPCALAGTSGTEVNLDASQVNGEEGHWSGDNRHKKK